MSVKELRETDVLAVLHAADVLDEGRILMRCPAHTGSVSASLEVTLNAGRYSLRCRYGCSPEKVLQAALDKLKNKCETCEASVIAASVRRS